MMQLDAPKPPADNVQLYRPAKPLNERLRTHARHMLEEEYYTGVIDFLSSLLKSGTSLLDSSLFEHFCPSADFLVVLSTISIHPLFTNRATTSPRAQAARSALILLRDISSLVGPVHAGYAEALHFRSHREHRHDVRRSMPNAEEESDSNDDLSDIRLRSKYASSESPWFKADDIWSVLGWAFTCALRHARRWEFWRPWLEWYIDTLERDWRERVRLFNTTSKARSSNYDDSEDSSDAYSDPRAEGLIMKALSQHSSPSALRRILRAILADGSTHKPENEFPEIWLNETKEKKSKTRGYKQHKKIDIEQGEYGDYDVDDDQDVIMADAFTTDQHVSVTQKAARRPKRNVVHRGLSALGGFEAVRLRQRLLALLCTVSADAPSLFTSLSEVLSVCSESFRSLPYEQFVTLTMTTCMEPEHHLAFCCDIMIDLAHKPGQHGSIFETDMETICQHFIRKAALSHSTLENVQMSLLVEAILKDLSRMANVSDDNEVYGDSISGLVFRRCVNRGVRAREKKTASHSHRGVPMDKMEARLRRDLKRSAARIEMLRKSIELGQTQCVRRLSAKRKELPSVVVG